MTCICCQRALSATDALPFLTGAAHFRCAGMAQLTGRIGAKVLVMVRRKGFARKAAR
jgi:hypothetical protein